MRFLKNHTFLKDHIFTLLTLLFITTLSLLPAREFPDVDVRFADKWAHWVMYGFLTLVMEAENIRHDARRGVLRTFPGPLGSFLLASLYGGVMELAQMYLTTTRHGEWLDVMANSFGAFCAFVILCLYITFAGNKHPDNDGKDCRPTALWNIQYIKVMTCNFLLFFAFYLLAPLLPLYLSEQFHADKDVIGVVLSGYVIATLLVRPFSGFVVDTFDRKTVLMICFFLFFICFSGYIGAGTLLMFAIVRTLHGIPFGSTTVVNSTVAIDVLPSARRNEGIGYYGLSNNIAMAIAPTAGIYIYHSTGNFPLLFWLSLLLAFLGFVCSTTIKLPKRAAVADKPKLSLDHFFLTRGWLLAVNVIFFGLCWGVMSNYVAIYGKEKLDITGGTGFFFMILSIGLVLSRLFGAKSLRAGHMTHNALVGVLLSFVGYCFFAFIPTHWSFYTSALLIGLGNGQMYPAFLNMFIKVARHDQRGTANSSILISWDLGMGLGILLGGVIAETLGFASAFYLVALMQGAGALLFICFTGKFFEQRRLNEN